MPWLYAFNPAAVEAGADTRGGNGPFAPPGPPQGGQLPPPGVFGKEKSTGTNIGKSPITDNHFHLILLE